MDLGGGHPSGKMEDGARGLDRRGLTLRYGGILYSMVYGHVGQKM